MRIGLAGFRHETHTFYPEPTTIEDFEVEGVARGDELIARETGVNSYIGGALAVLDEAGAEPVPILNAHAGVANRLTRECFEKYTGEIVEGLTEALPLDGVILAMHGAMAAEGVDKPEAEVTRRVREAVGDLPIMVTLDFHANEDHELTEAATAVFVCKQYPHTDTGETGAAAARCLGAMLEGSFTPVMAISKPGVASPSVFQGVDHYPMKEIRARADRWEQEEDMYYMSVAAGFGYADVPDIGASVIALTNDNPGLAREAADDVADLIWELRGPLANQPLPNPEEAVNRAVELVDSGVRPVVLANHSDRTGAATHILHELVRQGVTNFGYSTIWDPAAAQAVIEAGEGAEVEVAAGGQGSEYSGEPAKLRGSVEFAGNGDYVFTGPMYTGRKVVCGPTGVVDLGDNRHVIITTYKHQARDDQAFRAYGIDFDALDIIVVKSRVHFRAYYDDVAGEVIVVDAPGLGPADLNQFSYENVPADTYPIGKEWQ